MKHEKATSLDYTIYIAGDLEQAKQTCREWCMRVGGCVTVEPVAYIYTGGEETGVRVGFINYPRFPATEDILRSRACDLASLLMENLHQHSYSIVGPRETEWFSRRPDAAFPSRGEAE
jgi:hypothetical protein